MVAARAPSGRPPAYTDENIDTRVVEALRTRGFDVLTAQQAGLLHQDDASHLAYTAQLGRVLLTHDRGDFRRLHARYRQEERTHGGIVLLPQAGPRARIVIRAAMLLDWWPAAFTEGGTPRLVGWNDLQVRLHSGYRLPGYSEGEVRHALGLAEASSR